MSTRYSFLPWVRHGAASAVRNPDTLGPGLPLRPLLPVGLRVNGRSDVAASLQLRRGCGIQAPGQFHRDRAGVVRAKVLQDFDFEGHSVGSLVIKFRC